MTTDKASDTVRGISIFNDHNTTREDHHVRCVVYVINLTLKECLIILHAELSSIQNLTGSVRYLVKRRDLFDLMEKKCCRWHHPPANKCRNAIVFDFQNAGDCIQVQICFERSCVYSSTVLCIFNFRKRMGQSGSDRNILQLTTFSTEHQSGSLHHTIITCIHT